MSCLGREESVCGLVHAAGEGAGLGRPAHEFQRISEPILVLQLACMLVLWVLAGASLLKLIDAFAQVEALGLLQSARLELFQCSFVGSPQDVRRLCHLLSQSNFVALSISVHCFLLSKCYLSAFYLHRMSRFKLVKSLQARF